MLTLAEEMLYTTVKITTLSKGVESGSGTGFFWRINEGAGHVILLVTNKHVIEGADTIQVSCHIAQINSKGEHEPSGTFVNLNIDLDDSGLFNHPDSDVDLCGMGMSAMMATAKSAGQELFIRALEADNVPPNDQWEQFDAIEDVLMVGCPRGIFDKANNFPIVRKGITSSSLAKRYEGKNEFLVDMACFPGSLGSPVFMYNNQYFDKKSNAHVLGTRFYVLGVLFAGPLITAEGQIILSSAPKFAVQNMMHLGQVVRSSEIVALEQVVRKRLGPAPASKT